MMTASSDHITADIFVRFDRKPEQTEEMALINHMKGSYGFKWTGFSETGKWQTDKHAVIAFENKAFKARIKAACSGLSFFKPDGTACDMAGFIEAIQTFDEDAVDDDLSSLGTSSVPPVTPDKNAGSSGPASASASASKRPRA